MPYREPQSQDNRLTRVEMSVQRIELQLENMIKDLGDFKARIECVIDDHQDALYGDKGKPGLIGQLGSLEELRVALKGYGREQGLIADIQGLIATMAKWEDGRKWLNRLVIGMIVTNIAIHVINFIP
jgi:hypothetical protein